MFAYANPNELFLHLLVRCLGGIEKGIEPFVDELAVLDCSYEVILVSELPGYLRVDVGVDCVVEGTAVVRMEEQ